MIRAYGKIIAGGGGIAINAEEKTITAPFDVEAGDTFFKYIGRNTRSFVQTSGLLPASNAQVFSAKFSPDGKRLAIGFQTKIVIYEWNGSAFVVLQTITKSAAVYSIAFSPDSSILVFTTNVAPYIFSYKWNGSSYVALPAMTSLGGVGYSCAFSDDGMRLVVGGAAAPYVFVYSWNGSSFARMSALSSSGSYSIGVCFIPGTYNIVTSLYSTAPYAYIYEWIGSAYRGGYIGVGGVGSATGAGYNVAVSPNGQYLALAHKSSPYLTLHKWNGSGYIAFNPPGVIPTGDAKKVVFASNGLLAVTYAASPYVSIYVIDGDSAALAGVVPAPTGTIIEEWCGLDLSPGGRFLVVGGAGTQTPTLYVLTDQYTKDPITVTPEECVAYVAAESKTAGQDLKVYEIPITTM